MRIRREGVIFRTYRHIQRYRQILGVLFRHGFGDLINRLELGHSVELGVRTMSGKSLRMDRKGRAERLRMVMEELGPTFTKMGQILSTRPDLVPADLVAELSKLQDEVPPFPFGDVREIVQAELGMPLDAVFECMEEAPFAAASIGQVHRARLPAGREVAVKIQRPGIRETVEVDLEILRDLAGLAERRIPELKLYRPVRIVDEFARIIKREMDYTVEAGNMERFARQFQDNHRVRVPAVHRAFSTERVLTMEFVSGIKISEILKLDQAGLDRKAIAERGADLVLEQVFKHGFFHADPHPGNIVVLPENIVCYLDFGMMGYVDRRSREDFADLVYGYVQKSEEKTVAALLKIVETEQEPDLGELERDIRDFMEIHLYRPLKEIRLAGLLQDFMGILSKHRLILPENMYLMIKTLSQMESLGMMMDPDFDMTEKAAPFIRRIKAERYRPGRIISGLIDSGEEWLDHVRSVPAEVRALLSQVRLGKAQIGFEHRGLESLIFEMDRSSNRIAFALIISSLIIGSSLIIATDIGPYLFGFPIIGLAGFTVAGIFGIWLVIAIFRSGKL
ncbi:MAG TPA: AarF/UbiB family protein [Syntrophales bacterium]|nr:AarF/UbiB family protein [Syntrophales bacterium]